MPRMASHVFLVSLSAAAYASAGHRHALTNAKALRAISAIKTMRAT